MQVVVTDSNGTIVYANTAWDDAARAAGVQNLGKVSVGANYLTVVARSAESGEPEAAGSLLGLQSVISGASDYFDIEYPYKDCANYVFTRNEALIKDENTLFIQESPAEFMKKLKAEEGKDIWLIGGGEIVDIATKEHLADELMLFIMPVIIGDGLPLFLESSSDRKVELISSRSYPTGVVAMHYQFL